MSGVLYKWDFDASYDQDGEYLHQFWWHVIDFLFCLSLRVHVILDAFVALFCLFA